VAEIKDAFEQWLEDAVKRAMKAQQESSDYHHMQHFLTREATLRQVLNKCQELKKEGIICQL